MSVESARRFCEKIQQDKEFANSLKAAGTEMELTQRVLGAGFNFTQDELDQVLKADLSTASADRELSETELKAVAGGMIGGIGGQGGYIDFGMIIDQIASGSLRPTTYK
jgi:predicted ribosomally synthesized peptide with nif11-like leader